MLSSLFYKIFYQPLLNLLILIYIAIPSKDLGLAIIFLAFLIRVLLYPLDLKSIKAQKTLLELEPKLKEIREKFSDNKERLAKETFALYQKAKINPFFGVFLILVQLPIFIAIFKLFSNPLLSKEMDCLYSFLPNPGQIRPYFLTIDLSKPNFLLAILAGFFQFLQNTKTKGKTKNSSEFAKIFHKQILYLGPLFTFFLLLKLPSAIALYLVSSTIFLIFQTIYIQKKTEYVKKGAFRKN